MLEASRALLVLSKAWPRITGSGLACRNTVCLRRPSPPSPARCTSPKPGVVSCFPHTHIDGVSSWDPMCSTAGSLFTACVKSMKRSQRNAALLFQDINPFTPLRRSRLISLPSCSGLVSKLLHNVASPGTIGPKSTADRSIPYKETIVGCYK